MNVLPWDGRPESVLEGQSLAELERSALPAYVQGQRWFGGKARRVKGVRLVDRGELCDPRSPAYLSIFRVEFEDGSGDLYFLPLQVTTGPAAARRQEAGPRWVIARLTGPAGDAVLHDALADDATCTALLTAIGEGVTCKTTCGEVHAFATAAYARLRGDPARPLAVERAPATSSNTLVFYGRRLLLKVFRRLEVGVNPDFEIGRFLTEVSPFDRIPPVAGTIEYRRPEGGPVTLAILQALVPNQGDGWQHALAELRRYFERVAAQREAVQPDARSVAELAGAAPPVAVREAVGTYLDAAATLGRRTAEMHRALSRDTRDPAFAPEPFTASDLEAVRASTRAQGRAALEALRANLGRLPPAVADAGPRLLQEGPALLECLAGEGGDGFASCPRQGQVANPSPPSRIRCHGDYHLGQTLWVDNDYFIIDFEGEPTRPIAERRAKQSALKDVAGMLRSYDYAAYAGLFAFTARRPADFERLEPWAALWQQWVSAAFVRSYLATAAGARFLPATAGEFADLLDLLMLDKAFYELVYELNNRPDWVRIPLRGVLDLLASPDS